MKTEKTSANPNPTLSETLGAAAFARRDYFNSFSGQLLWRNFVSTLACVPPFVALNASMQHGLEACKDKLPGMMKNKVAQSIVTVGASFSLFRALKKCWAKAYDRLFSAASPEEAAKVIDAMPAQAVSDMAAISPAEYAATAVAALPLVAVKHVLKTPEPMGLKGNPGQAVAGWGNDVLSGIPAYTVFFETTDRLFHSFTAREKPGEPKTANGFIHDTPAKLAFRGAASVALGMMPYLALQRAVHVNVGGMNPAKNTLIKDIGVGIAGFSPFAFYTSTSEAWQRMYDQLVNAPDAQKSK